MLLQLEHYLRDYRPEPEAVDAGVLMAVTAEAMPQLILTRRAGHLSSHAGEVAFPGGKRDEEDSSIIATALRESWEEIGLPESVVQVIGQLDVFTSKAGLRVQPIIGKVSADIVLRASPEEIESIFRVPLDFFLTEKPVFTYKFEFMGHEVTVPSFNYGDYVIWGLTAFMIVDLMNRVYDANIEFPWPASMVKALKLDQ
jgi:8-oxo-dGTP pyrophosphatase MutT (NUDIX family)